VLQLNCHKSRATITSLKADLPSTPFIYLLQEPYIWQSNPCGLTKFNLHFLPDISCQAAIYASPELGLSFHPSLSSRDCATCSIVVEDEKIFFSSVYLDCLLTVKDPAWLRTIAKTSSARRHYLAGIDTNAHSDVWCSTSTTDRRDHDVETILFQAGLCVLNKGTDPTFETAKEATCIDITVVSPALASVVKNWKVMQEMHLSDHHLIAADLPLKTGNPTATEGQASKKSRLERIHKTVATAFINFEDPVLWTATTIDQQTSFLFRAIEAALDVVALITPYRPKKAIFSWWSVELNDMRMAARAAHNRSQKRPRLPERWEEYRKLRRTFKRECL
jgi:hypothetical protein